MELWEIKQFGEKQDKSVTVTRTITGKLPPQRTYEATNSSSSSSSSSSRYSIGPARSNEELKEKMEQQLKLQRQAHQQKTIQRGKFLKNHPNFVKDTEIRGVYESYSHFPKKRLPYGCKWTVK